MISLVFANVGTGKTTLLAKLASNKKNQKNYDYIFSNVPLFGAYQFDIKDMGKLHIENSLLLIDEGAEELSNNVMLPAYQKTWLRLHRHYRCDIWIVSQSYEDVNIVARRLYGSIWIMKRVFFLPFLSYIRMVGKYVGIDEMTRQIVDFYQVKFNIPFVTSKFIYRPLYYRFFDSYDAPTLEPFTPIKWTEETVTTYVKWSINEFKRDMKVIKTVFVKSLGLDLLKKKKVTVDNLEKKEKDPVD